MLRLPIHRACDLKPVPFIAMLPAMTLKAVIYPAEEGGYWAEVPALPGCFSQGETMDEIRANIREAIEGWLMAEETAARSAPAGEIIEVAV